MKNKYTTKFSTSNNKNVD